MALFLSYVMFSSKFLFNQIIIGPRKMCILCNQVLEKEKFIFVLGTADFLNHVFFRWFTKSNENF